MSLCVPEKPMHVCAASQPDPETNTCFWIGCGYNSIAPNASFGGCSGAKDNQAGALCICGVQSWYVDAASGKDVNEGSSASPLKTITKALSLATANQSVHVRPGNYDAANGETFPLQVPAGVSLIGDEPNRGASTGAPVKIAGNVNMGAGSTLAGFTVTSAGNGVTLPAANVVVRSNTITGNGSWAVVVSSSTNHLIALNAITNNASLGIYSAAAATATGKVENNTITGNSFGIEYDAGGGDLGGGSFGSVGNNIISCNANTDLWLNTSLAATASNNRWDHVPPAQSSAAFGNGLDIYTNTGATVTTAGAALAPNPCPACSGSAVSSQVFDNTMIGCAAPGTPAAIAYTSRATLCPSYCHVCTAAEWNGHRGSIAPNSNYWTGDNPLFFISGPTGNCTVSATCTAPSCTRNVCAPGAMLVCQNASTNCQENGCGLDTTTPQFFGGCSESSGAGQWALAQGTLCCCP
jgi:hypothetical protein